MTLEQAIHQRWAANQSLGALLPAERLTTGRASAAAAPYATLLRRRSQTVFRTNAGDALDEVRVAIHVWHDDYDAARAIADAVNAAFDRSRFDLAEGRRVVQMRRLRESTVQHDDGTWQLALEFQVELYLPAQG